jgi:hypothetical protein
MKTNSTKERLLIRPEHFIKLANGYGLCPTANSQFIDKINYVTQTRNTRPKITIQYTRSSYDKNGIKITLDNNRKGQKVSAEQKLECFNIDANKSCIFKLNCAILEVKTDTNINVLDTHLIQTLMNKKLIKSLNAFSKYATIYYFFQQS